MSIYVFELYTSIYINKSLIMIINFGTTNPIIDNMIMGNVEETIILLM